MIFASHPIPWGAGSGSNWSRAERVPFRRDAHRPKFGDGTGNPCCPLLPRLITPWTETIHRAAPRHVDGLRRIFLTLMSAMTSRLEWALVHVEQDCLLSVSAGDQVHNHGVHRVVHLKEEFSVRDCTV